MHISSHPLVEFNPRKWYATASYIAAHIERKSIFMKYARVLIVEDDEAQQAIFAGYFRQHEFRCEIANSIATAKKVLALFTFDAVLLDMRLGEEDGMDLVPYIAREYPFTKVIVMSAGGSIDLAVDAMDKGAASFISKSNNPQKIAEELKKRIGRKIETIEPIHQVFKKLGLMGNSDPMKNLFHELEQLKDVDATILISGESGTGKELVARALHSISNRSTHRFEAINCGAIPENLLESELFGYKKGAFTDAKTDKKGIFEVCSEGTLFLDEIGEMPLSLQVKLLRVLQEKEIKPIGSTQTLKINTRVLAATNKNLREEVDHGNFRDDLFFRVSVFLIDIPPLRERQGDIPLLTEYLVDKLNKRYNRQIKMPSKELMSRLKSYKWPGNIRELQNSIERAIVLSKDSELHIERMFSQKETLSGKGSQLRLNEDLLTFTEAKKAFEIQYLRKILTLTRGNVTEASHLAGRFRSDLYRLMEKHHIHQDEFRN